jgi:hypothetical protein
MKPLEAVTGFGSIIALFVSGSLLFPTWEEKRLLDKGTPQPQRITLAELAAKSEVDNVHLTITDFDWGTHYVAEERKGGSLACVWFPLVPPGHNERIPRQSDNVIRVVVKSTKVRTDAEVQQLASRTELTGIVTNDIASMGANPAEKLYEYYPGANFKKAFVIEEGREFPNAERGNLLLASGVGLAILGVILGVGWILLRWKAAGVPTRRGRRSREGGTDTDTSLPW